MIDKFRDPLLTPQEAIRHLRIPRSTLYRWLGETAYGDPLVHHLPTRRGHPSLPFVALIEAYVLRSLRDLGLSKVAIRDAAEEVRRLFGTPYGLATSRIATDGIDVFVHYVDSDEYARVGDGQRPFREVIKDHLRYIAWDPDQSPRRLTLKQYPDIAPVIIDPRFNWGAPVLARTHVSVDAIVGMWRAGESFDVVADEYGLSLEEVEAVIRVAA